MDALWAGKSTMAKDDDDSDDQSVATVTEEDILKSEADKDADLPFLPIVGFGSARYGVLGFFDLTTIERDPKDSYECWTSTYRYVHGYRGEEVTQISAGESHVSILMDVLPDHGGRLYTHGLANGGRLGIGQVRKEKASLFALVRGRRKGKDKKTEEEDDIMDYKTKDFSGLFQEETTVPYKGEDTRFQPNPSKVQVEKVMQTSCGQSHGACVTSQGTMYMWGVARFVPHMQRTL